MSAAALTRPDASEYAPYYGRYVSLVEDADVVSTLERQGRELSALVRAIPESRADFRYAEGKWSIRDLLGHVIDGERVFAFRALCFARGDAQPLPGFEQDDWAPVASAGLASASIADLVEEFELLRRSNVRMLRRLTDADWTRTGIASGNPVSVRAIAFIMAGHVVHHTKVLRERYLAG
ncbi:MAG TPA: DinB family protein [Thermoanaerobaculia bacterium]|nr:DinB family protein [Thermoanaerobaculia bacterium]